MNIQPLYQPKFAYLYGERRIEHVPRPSLYRPIVQTFSEGIDFCISPGNQGVFVQDIIQNAAMSMIDNADDHVLENLGWRTTVVNLEWPGFVPTTHKNPMHARIDTYRNGHPITRLQFAQEICFLFCDFHRRCCRHPLATGYERWSMNPDMPHSIKLSDVVLYSVHYYRNVWVPELYVK